MGSNKKHIVIIGTGFGGLYSYLELHKIFHKTKDIKITLVNKTDYFLFVPMIHEVATGNLSPSSVIQPILTIPQCCLDEFVHGEVDRVNADDKKVFITRDVSGGSSGKINKDSYVIEYDYLIMGLGSVSNYFNIPGAREYCLELKNLKDAKNIKNRVIQNFEHARCVQEEDICSHLTFAVIGGGPTGVELAGELSDLVYGELATAFPDIYKKSRIVLLHGKDRLIDRANPWLSDTAYKILKEKNVDVRLNNRVTKIDQSNIFTDNGNIRSCTAIWTAGVKARSLEIESKSEIKREFKTGRIVVNNNLQLNEYPEFFVVGDQACIIDKESGQPYPMRAQFAVREGKVAARNIHNLMRKKPLKEFCWNDKGFIVSLGKGGAIAQIGGVLFSGRFAWWLYRTAYLFKLIGIRMKIRTAIEWTINLFSPRDISKL